MQEIQEAILEAVDRMRTLLKDRSNIDEEEVKTDISIANATSQLAKAFIASKAIDYKVNNAEKSSKIMLEETF